MPLIAIDSADDPRIDDYRNLTDAELRRRRDHPVFIAEGLLVIRRLLASPYPVRSLLLTEAKRQRLAPDLDTLDPQVPIYLAPPDVLNAIAGFHVHRGALASATRTPLPPADGLLAGATLVVILEGINDHENLGALFRNAARSGPTPYCSARAAPIPCTAARFGSPSAMCCTCRSLGSTLGRQGCRRSRPPACA